MKNSNTKHFYSIYEYNKNNSCQNFRVVSTNSGLLMLGEQTSNVFLLLFLLFLGKMTSREIGGLPATQKAFCLFFFFLSFSLFILRQRQREWGRGRESGRERQNPKQAPHGQRRAQGRARTHERARS